MSEQFANSIMRHVVTLMCYNIGWDASQVTALDILADVMKRHFLQLAKSTHSYSELYGRTDPNLDDVALALKELNISGAELEEYVQNFDPVVLSYKVPLFPTPRESKLNFLRPGSEEVLSRPVHVHEYMPPMIFERKNVESSGEGGKDFQHEPSSSSSQADNAAAVLEATASIEQMSQTISVPLEPAHKSLKGKKKDKSPEKDVNHQHHGLDQDQEMDSSEDEIEALGPGSPGGTKGFVPFSGVGTKSKTKRGGIGENPAIKRVRMMLEEDGHPLREISSVMMTTSGFLTSSREGRLPETRPPANREFFDPVPIPPTIERKKKPLTMKRIVEGIKKIEKENESDRLPQDQESDKEEPQLFGNPDKISTKPLPQSLLPSISKPPKSELKQSKKLKKKLKIDKEMIKKLAQGLEQRDRDKKKLKMFKKSTKVLLDKSKKLKDKKFIQQQQAIELAALAEAQQVQARLLAALGGVREEGELEDIDSEDEQLREQSKKRPSPRLPPQQQLVPPLMRIPKKKQGLLGLVDPVKLKKFKNKSMSISQSSTSLISPPKLGHIPGPTPSSSRGGYQMGGLPKKRGRPRKQPLPPPVPMFPGHSGGGVPLSAAALANLGRGLMEDRPLKIKKSHMEPDMRSLIPEVHLDLNVPPHQLPSGMINHQLRNTKGGNKPPRMQPAHQHQHPQQQGNFDLLLGLPSTPGLIPSNFVLPPPPPLKKMPTPSTATQMPMALHTSTPPTQREQKKIPFSNVCSSLTITPIDMGGPHKLPTRFDKNVTPGIGSPGIGTPPPVLKSKPKQIKDSNKPTPGASGNSGAVPVQMLQSEPSSGITITPIVMEKMERYSQGAGAPSYDDEGLEPIHDDEYDEEYENPVVKEKPVSMLVKLEEDMKSKESRKKEKERRKELKKEKKKDKKDKSKDKDKKEKREKDKDRPDKKKKNREKLLSGDQASGGPTNLSVPKLTLKLSSGTPTPVDSPNPPPIFVGEASPPLKNITIKPLQVETLLKKSITRTRTPSPELARFSPLVTRPPKPSRAAKVHAAAAVAADAMGATLSQQMTSFPSTLSQKRGGANTSGSRSRQISKGEKDKADKPSSSKSSRASLGGLITETVGCIVDEHGNKIWICPSCKRQDDGSPMIGCDRCDDWYHFVCVGITETPEEDTEWYCPRCRMKKKKDKK